MAGLGTIGVASAGAGIGTTSFFSDEERFDGNELVAGELDLKVDWQTRYYGPQESEVYGAAGRPYVNAYPDEDGDGKQDAIRTRSAIADDEYGTTELGSLSDSERQTVERIFRDQFADRSDGDAPILDLNDVKPGDHGEVTFSLHLFDNPGWIQLFGELLKNAENTITEPEASDPDEDDDETTPEEDREGELAQTIRATVWYDEDGDNELDRYDGDGDIQEGVIAEGTLNNVLARLRGGVTLDGDRTEPSRQPFENSTTHHLGFKWELPVDHANEIQTDSVSFTLGFYTEQYRHNPAGPSPEPYQDELPSIPTVDATADGSSVPLTMQQATHRFHEDLPATTVWGYHDGYLGPTIEARAGNEVTVEYTNSLPPDHLLPVDTTLHGADGTPAVRNVPHLHGGNVPDEVDGWPAAWVTPDGQVGSGPGTGNVDTSGSAPVISYTYPNTQPASQLWYHDHALGITRLNVYAGLAGLYTLRDQTELDLLEENRGDGTGLPSGDYEIPLVLQGKSFEEDGSLAYPDGSDLEDPEGDNPSPSAVPEFFGDTAVVNGKAWPYLEVEPRKYRFRMINACNSRFLSLKLYEWDENSHTFDKDSPGPGFTLVGTDGGLLESPTDVPDRLLMNPANRFDVVIDFSGYEGQDFVLHN
ncbi:MAG: multicopper oxidase family protein, partial [Haloferacaceae archaeon]